MQDNASHFAENNRLTKTRTAAVEKLGGYRDPISNGARSFKAAYGQVHELDRVLPGGLKVRDKDGNESLLKMVKAVPKTSKEPIASMVTEHERVARKAPVAGSGAPMGKIPLAAGTRLEDGRQKLPREPASSSSSGASSSSVPTKPPTSREDRFEGLRLMQGYLGSKKSAEELAAAKAKAAENKRLKEVEDARKVAEKLKKAQEKAAKEAADHAAREERKTLLKRLTAERHAVDKARLAAKKSG
jgi:hypothetical protein